MFYRAGIIERWGMGTLNIIDWCSENGNPPPVWSQQSGSVYVTFKAVELLAEQETDQVAGEVAGEIRQLLHAVKGDMKRQEIQAALGLKHEDHFRQAYLVPALKAGLIEMTVPGKPRSSKQKYRLTDKGRKVLKRTGAP
jgi:ATP-dependent DNA helicase RecG